jgi:guanylate kinase
MKVLVIIGPSGVGKSEAVYQLQKSGLVTVQPTYTNRPLRKGLEEVEHKFVTTQVINQLEQNGYFFEVVQPFGLPYKYGLPKIIKTEGKIPLIILRSFYIKLLGKHLQDNIIYQIESPYNLVKQRVLSRGNESVGTRLDGYQKEIEQGKEYADRIFSNNSDIDNIVQELEKAIRADFNNT